MLLSFASLPSSASWHASTIEQQKYIINLQPSQLVQVQFLAAFPTSRYTTSSVPSSHPTVLPYQVDPALARTCVVAFDILGFAVFVISVLLLHMFRRLFSLVGYRMIYYIDIWFLANYRIFGNSSLYYARERVTPAVLAGTFEGRSTSVSRRLARVFTSTPLVSSSLCVRCKRTCPFSVQGRRCASLVLDGVFSLRLGVNPNKLHEAESISMGHKNSTYLHRYKAIL